MISLLLGERRPPGQGRNDTGAGDEVLFMIGLLLTIRDRMYQRRADPVHIR
jgi:hypothetical protein